MNPRYVIQANWQINKGSYQGFFRIDSFLWVSSRQDASLFDSRVVANGWLQEAKLLFPKMSIQVIVA